MPTPLRSDVRRIVIHFRRTPTRRAWYTAWSHLRSSVQPNGLGALLPNSGHAAARSLQTSLLIPRAIMHLPLLVTSTRKLAIAEAVSAAVPLIGAGPGLTPSWDDLLIGYISGLRTATSGEQDKTDFLSRFGAAIQTAGDATTEVSRRYIDRVKEGDSPPWIEDVLAAIEAGNVHRTSRATRDALHIGSTSGTDMMLGALLGSAVWQSGPQLDEVLATLSCRNSHSASKASGEDHATH